MGRWFEGESNVSVQKTPIPSEGNRISKLYMGRSYWKNVFSQFSFDLVEALHLPVVKPRGARALLTLHDIREIQRGRGRVRRAAFNFFLASAVNKANHIITVSSTMRNEILSHYPETSVSVVYNGLDVSLYPSITEADCRLFRKKYCLPSEFLLAVGHFEARKNYSRLIDAIRILKRSGVNCPLVIIGNDSGERSFIAKKIELLGLSTDVTLLSGLTDLEVRCAYLSCILFIFPSLYEGFGIPILEAMAAKKPMVLSDLAVFREITENRMLYFSPQSPEEMAEKIEAVLVSNQYQSDMVKYGSQRVGYFNFQRLAGEISSIYSKIIL